MLWWRSSDSDSLNTAVAQQQRVMSQPQPTPYYPPPPSPHSHDKYIGAIIAVGVVALLVGAAFGYGLGSLARPLGTSPLPQGTQFTFVHGTVNIYPHSGTAFGVYFDNQNTGTLTSVVGGQGLNYQLYLPTGNTYQVTIYYFTSVSGTQSCSARPSPFTSTGSSYTQDFLC